VPPLIPGKGSISPTTGSTSWTGAMEGISHDLSMFGQFNYVVFYFTYLAGEQRGGCTSLRGPRVSAPTCEALVQKGSLRGPGPKGQLARPWSKRAACEAPVQKGSLQGPGPKGVSAPALVQRVSAIHRASAPWTLNSLSIVRCCTSQLIP
jgi:hypothetical protein